MDRNSARVDPTAPTRAGKLSDASVDPIEARKQVRNWEKPFRQPIVKVATNRSS
jgi:hypothetical protein